MPTVLHVKELTKHFDRIKAVNGVSFDVDSGTCFGLLGPNGAGKTTTIEMIEDIITPTTGHIFYKENPRTGSFREEVGIQFQHTALLGFLTVRETLQTFADLYSHPHDLDDLVRICQLGDIEDQYNDKISGGQRQRLLLAMALVNQPKLLFLDEPSTGLDPHARHELWKVVEQIKAQGKTIILTTHYMEEAARLCDQIAIMDFGKIIARGTPEDLIRQYCGGASLTLPKKLLETIKAGLKYSYRESGDRLEFFPEDTNACLAKLIELGVDLTEMSVRSPNLEDVFLTLTGRQLRD
ncbi:MAG: ABC transporter ATP-binding protein [Desulfobacterales bacterium]|nr:ABC transporter ATP-binding protein [Desulfobacterales bacterium]